MTALRNYALNTLDIHRNIDGVFMPKSEIEVQQIIEKANREGLKLWPISSGKNWGYGSASPVSHNNVIVDLIHLNEIIKFDQADGIITLGPGVTQGQLYDFLKNTDYITPSTGAGPDVSVLSNLLERGYGLAPIQDHFSALISLKAYLGDGRVFNSSLDEIVGEGLAKKFRWGIGPYLNGIFSQSNFAIVTQVTIQLAKRAKHIELLKFTFSSDQLSNVINSIKSNLQDYPSLLSGVNLMNKERMLSMGVEKAEDWTGILSINSDKNIVKAVKKSIKKSLKKHAKISCINKRQIELLKYLPLPKSIKKDLDSAEELFYILNGRPTKMALNLCYLKNPQAKKTFNPDEDNCGLIWYSPLVEMNSKSVNEYTQFIRDICEKYNIEPLITLTSLGHAIFDSTVPILFSKTDTRDETLNAHNCYNDLLKTGRKKGFYPYRMGVAHMESLTQAAPNFFNIAASIKDILDPNSVIAPGRYSKK
ncbi:FAD-dependent oxidoreductase [Halobacteriovorax sp. HLS]|uniref:FAD-binding oxidoreductase n=1 Tax=Halobacteriovorax sp. HLS TaxID=2234000 RepID=UPI0013E29A9D|nr:FAD-dependent oxidoreductase [Halobacteriovorax sp. HLS]